MFMMFADKGIDNRHEEAETEGETEDDADDDAEDDAEDEEGMFNGQICYDNHNVTMKPRLFEKFG